MDSTRFDQLAATWDDNPTRVALTKAVAHGIMETVPLSPDWTALEYGCGTAALSFLLSAYLRTITAADASEGMLAQVEKKLAGTGVHNITPVRMDLERDAAGPDRYDFICNSMVLHHVTDTAKLVSAFASVLVSGGWLAITDLCKEDGSFHPDMTVPHHGFEPAELAALLTAAGFCAPAWRTIHAINRNGRDYPVFLLTAQRA